MTPVKVTTRNDTDCLCSIISIQQPTCPFYDEVGTSMRHGVYSTMMDQVGHLNPVPQIELF